jgi:hypothetical protein
MRVQLCVCDVRVCLWGEHGVGDVRCSCRASSGAEAVDGEQDVLMCV